ncbi:MAG TPA: sensor histidine kinase, partial [Burkholderiales bacterium]|nr:sensor histidine kinase [Burkholderiales bacterium]
MRIRPVALRTRLLYLAAAAIVPLAVMSGVSLLALLHQQRQQAERAGIELARALATAVDAELQRSISVLQVLAAAPSLERREIERFHELTRRALQNNPSWLTVVLADPQGRQVTNARYAYGDALPQIVDRASFERVLLGGEPAIGSLARGPGSQLAVPVRVPVIRAGELRYVLTAAVKPDDFVDIINRQRVPGDWVVSVFDVNSSRVARSRQHREYLGGAPAPSLTELMRRAGDEGAGITQVLEGESVYTTYSRSHETGWTVAIGIPRSYVELAALRSLIVYGGGLLISIALAIVAALIVGRGIARPMAELGAAARALGRRERLELPHTPIREIRQVADSLAVAADERTRGEAEREQLLEREQQARAIAEAANRSKDEFLAMLGHELRNPLGAIANAGQLLGAPDEQTRAHARAVIGRQVQHLARMTDDLLDAARAMTGKIILQRQPLDLADAAGRVLSTLRASGRTGQRRIVQALEPGWVDADPTRIEQIIGNLVGNALKFTPEGGTITVAG